MAITSTSTDSTATATVTVRVPRTTDTDLATAAEQRLARLDGIERVSVDGLDGIEPRLSATAVTAAVTIRSTISVAELQTRLADATTVDAIERLD